MPDAQSVVGPVLGKAEVQGSNPCRGTIPLFFNGLGPVLGVQFTPQNRPKSAGQSAHNALSLWMESDG